MNGSLPGRQRILVVDDDPEIARIVDGYLRQAGFLVTVAYDGRSGLEALRRDRPDLVVLDLMLPDSDGWEITRLMRADVDLRGIAIIHLTARVEDLDKILGLELGADDYISKPFNPRELVARVKAVLRRGQAAAEPSAALSFGRLRLDPESREVLADGRPVELTRTEFALLEALMRRPGHVHSRQSLISSCLGVDSQVVDRTLDSHVRNLRRKIDGQPPEGTPAVSAIQTVHGIGYRLAARPSAVGTGLDPDRGAG